MPTRRSGAKLKTYFVYMLECADGTIYTGITTDLHRRLREHQNGEGGGYTRARGAAKILFSQKCRGRSSASKREAAFKKLSRREKLAVISKRK